MPRGGISDIDVILFSIGQGIVILQNRRRNG